MKKKTINSIIIGICSLMLLTGCQAYWSLGEVVSSIDNEYFKTKVLYSGENNLIIENELTGEKFLVIHDTDEIAITPIKEVQENEN